MNRIDAFPELWAGPHERAMPLRRTDLDGDAEGEAPVVDLLVFEALGASIGGEMMTELLEKVRADLAAAEAALRAAVGGLDLAAIRATSHILISVAGAIGAKRLQLCAEVLNSVSHAGERDDIAAKVLACLGEISAALAFAQHKPVAG